MKVMKASALPEDDTMGERQDIVGGTGTGQGMWRFGKLGGRTRDIPEVEWFRNPG